MRSGNDTDFGSNGVPGLFSMCCARAFPMHAIYAVDVSDVAHYNERERKRKKVELSPDTEP